MRILVLNADYPKFLRHLYLSVPGLHEASHDEQLRVRNESLFGVADFYSRNFKARGHAAAEIHLNNQWLQHAWARENGLKLDAPPPPVPDGSASASRPADWLRSFLKPVGKRLLGRFAHRVPGTAANQAKVLNGIFLAQVEAMDPDVILNQEMVHLRSPVLKKLKRPGRLILGQIASQLPRDEDFGVYDLVISSLPNLVEWFRGQGVRAEVNRLAFEPSILQSMPPQPERDIALSFVGSLSPEHGHRIAFLEQLARDTPLQLWGNGIERLPPSSPLHARYRGEAWGRDMYDILRRSRITLNHHIDLAEDWANNMRLYEAPGAGTLLLTDAKRNLREIYTPGEEVETYSGAEDCIAQVNRLLADEKRRADIALKGHRRCLEVHNYYTRTGEIAALCGELRRPGQPAAKAGAQLTI